MKNLILILSFCISLIFANNINTEQNYTLETNKTQFKQKTNENNISQPKSLTKIEAFIQKSEFSTFCTAENLSNNPVRKFLNGYISWLKSLSVKNILLAIVAFLLYLLSFSIFMFIIGLSIMFLFSLIGIDVRGKGLLTFSFLITLLALPASDLYFNNPLAIIGIPFDLIVTGIKLFLGIFGIYIENTGVLFLTVGLFVIAIFIINFVYLHNKKRKIKKIVSSLKSIFYIVAMADGKLSKEEEKYLKRIMYDFAKSANIDEELAKYITKEEASKVSTQELKTYINNLSPLFELDKNLKENFFKALIEFSLIDGLNEKKKEILSNIAQSLNIDVGDIEEYIMHNFYQQENNEDFNNSSQQADYYQILGIDENATCEEIKKKYKELAKKYHPDKVASKDLDEEFVKFAEEMFKKVNNAYETLSKIKNCK